MDYGNRMPSVELLDSSSLGDKFRWNDKVRRNGKVSVTSVVVFLLEFLGFFGVTAYRYGSSTIA